jgi:hypothetical protein
MAFGFPARYVEEIELEVDRDAARHAIVETLEALGWQYEKPHPDSYIAKTRVNMLSYGEKVRIHFTENASLEIRSTCAMPSQLFDWGKNKTNVDGFVRLFMAKASRMHKLWPARETPGFDDDGNTPLQRALIDEE